MKTKDTILKLKQYLIAIPDVSITLPQLAEHENV